MSRSTYNELGHAPFLQFLARMHPAPCICLSFVNSPLTVLIWNSCLVSWLWVVQCACHDDGHFQ